MEEQFKKEFKQGRRYAADAARISDDRFTKKKELSSPSQGNDRIIAQAWVNVRGGLRVFAVYVWRSEGWTLRNEAVMKAVVTQARTTGHPWVMACDANMEPQRLQKKFAVTGFPRIQKATRLRGCVITSLPVGPHKTVTFLVERDMEIQDVREWKMPNTLPGYSGGKCQEEARQNEDKQKRRRKMNSDGSGRR